MMTLTPVLITLISALVGAFIGTFFGTFFNNLKSENKIKKVRKIAIKASDIMEKYAKGENTYCNAKEDFNNTLSIAEKRAVLVCLHKLGIPIEIPIKNIFDIKKIQFLPKLIDKDEIEGIRIQINNGHCDHLFFMDVDKYFIEDTRIKTIRNAAKKFVNEVFSKCTYDSNNRNITYPSDWRDKFSYGEYKAILVFTDSIKSDHYFDNETGKPKNIEQFTQDIEIGLWDMYLHWDYDAYQSMLTQTKSAKMMIDSYDQQRAL
ncbi:MAG: hypothetical protein LBI42_05370 [Chitinispirillales bacterium]|jgi:hypothetical protein|nr:hypothetical protein [Chitinispirillales bacterium]